MRLCLGIPVVGHVSGEVYHSHLGLAAEIGKFCEGGLIIPSVRNIFPHARARQEIMDQALDKSCTHLLFFDSDMESLPGVFRKLRNAMVETGAQMVTGWAYRRGYPFTGVWWVGDERDVKQVSDVPENHPYVELTTCGLSCNLIDVEFVRQHMTLPHFYQNESIWEDAYFCSRLKAVGGKIFGDPSVRPGHLGEHYVIDDTTVAFLRGEWLRLNPPKGE